MDNKQDLIYSAFGAICIYIILILSFLVYLKTTEVTKIDATVKNTVLQLDVILETSDKIEEKITVKNKIQNQEIANKIVKKTTSASVKQKSDLKSLFANVKTNASKVSKENVSNVKKSSIASRFKSKFEKEKKRKNIVLSKLVDKVETKSSSKNVAMNNAQKEQDPYYSKIYQILSSAWRPTIFEDDLISKVNIVISNNGTFSYKFIQYSGNVGFDNQLKAFLNNETRKSYPVSPTNKTVNIEITFQSKG